MPSILRVASSIIPLLKTDLVKEVISRLKKRYGERKWILQPDAAGVLVQTILSQNTSDTNSGRAYDSLLGKFKNWETVSKASPASISKSIKSGGLSDVKAIYIKESLQEIKRRRGIIDLGFLNDLLLNDARKWLTDLPGVGLKTANVVLLFALGMSAVPVDTHIFRVSKRLGLIGDKSSLEKAHQELEKMVPKKEAYPFHILMIEHGRKTCHARNPECRKCVMVDICPSARLFLAK